MARRQTAFTVIAWIAYGLVIVRLFSEALNTLALYGQSTDLHVYVVAAHTALTHGSIYDYVNPSGYPFTYPPFAALALVPTVIVDEQVLRVVWVTALILGAAYLARLLTPYAARWFGADNTTRSRSPFSPALPVMMILVTASGPSSAGLINAQISLFIVLLVIVDCLRFLPGRYGGIATGIAAAIKLTPLIFIPYFWVTGRRRAAVTSTITFLACTGLAYLIRPQDSSRYWFTELWDFGRVAQVSNPGNQSVRGTLARIGVSGHALTGTWIALVIGIVVLGLWRAWRAERAGHPLLAAAIVGAASVCASPVSWEHHCFWLLIAAIGMPIAGKRWRLAWPMIVAVVMLGLRPYELTAYLNGLLPLRLLGLIVSAQALLAVAVACFVPFREIRRHNDDAPIVDEQDPPFLEPENTRLAPATGEGRA